MNTEYQNIPQQTIDSLERYKQHHIPTGGFLRCVLTNDLFGAIGKADVGNRYAIYEICLYIYNELPVKSWGSEQQVNDWLKV